MKSNWVTNEAVNLTGMCCFLVNGLMSLGLSAMDIPSKCTAVLCFLVSEMSDLWTEARDEKLQIQIILEKFKTWKQVSKENILLDQSFQQKAQKDYLMYLKTLRPSR